jgi:hypothetical protein
LDANETMRKAENAAKQNKATSSTPTTPRTVNASSTDSSPINNNNNDDDDNDDEEDNDNANNTTTNNNSTTTTPTHNNNNNNNRIVVGADDGVVDLDQTQLDAKQLSSRIDVLIHVLDSHPTTADIAQSVRKIAAFYDVEVAAAREREAVARRSALVAGGRAERLEKCVFCCLFVCLFVCLLL